MFHQNVLPEPLKEWVGRDVLLRDLNKDWENPDHLITGIIGFGGEGKTSLARQWLETISKDSSIPQPKGVFWWTFTEGKGIDDFFEAALKFFIADIDSRELPSPSLKSKVILSFLTNTSYVLVLDGLGAHQHQDGDSYGFLTNDDIKGFLRDFARGGHKSFCIITSRAPIIDLIDFSSYIQREVGQLTFNESSLLLQKLGVDKDPLVIEKIVKTWNGYALALNLIGTCLKNFKDDANISQIYQIQPLIQDQSEYYQPEYFHLHQILNQYSTYLTSREREILCVLSAFRLPVSYHALKQVIQTTEEEVERLIKYRVVQNNSDETYSIHPLISSHYNTVLNSQLSESKKIHRQIHNFYLSLAEPTSEEPTLEQLVPIIEAVHHLCKAEDFKEANKLRQKRIDQGDTYVLTHKLGAYDRALKIVKDFFPGQDTDAEPCLDTLDEQLEIIGEVGYYLLCIGRLSEALKFFIRQRMSEKLTTTLAVAAGVESWQRR